MTLLEFNKVLETFNLEGAVISPRRTEIIWRGMSIVLDTKNRNPKVSVIGNTDEFSEFGESLQKKLGIDRYSDIEIKDIAVDKEFKDTVKEELEVIAELERQVVYDTARIQLLNDLISRWEANPVGQELEALKRDIHEAIDVYRDHWTNTYDYEYSLELKLDSLVRDNEFNKETIASKKYDINVARRKAHKRFKQFNLPIYEIICGTKEDFLLLMIEFMNYIGKQNNVPEVDSDTYHNVLMGIDARILNEYNENKTPLKNIPEYAGFRARSSKKKIGAKVIDVVDTFETSVGELIAEGLKLDANNNYVGDVTLSADIRRGIQGNTNYIRTKADNVIAGIYKTDDSFDFAISYANEANEEITVSHHFRAGVDCVQLVNRATGRSIAYYGENNTVVMDDEKFKKASAKEIKTLLDGIGSATQFMQDTIKEYRQKQVTK